MYRVSAAVAENNWLVALSNFVYTFIYGITLRKVREGSAESVEPSLARRQPPTVAERSRRGLANRIDPKSSHRPTSLSHNTVVSYVEHCRCSWAFLCLVGSLLGPSEPILPIRRKSAFRNITRIQLVTWLTNLRVIFDWHLYVYAASRFGALTVIPRWPPMLGRFPLMVHRLHPPHAISRTLSISL